jgi:Holliday junction resolvase RusA-like endonuclease
MDHLNAMMRTMHDENSLRIQGLIFDTDNNQTTINHNFYRSYSSMVRFTIVDDDMVITMGPGGRRGDGINFEVQGNPLVQERHKLNRQYGQFHMYDPSSAAKIEFAKVVKDEMEAHGWTSFPYFPDKCSMQMTAKFVLPRPKSDFIKNRTPPQLKPTALPFPRGKDVDNLGKFVADALQLVLYANDKDIVRQEIEKCYATDITESVGWTELNFVKVVCYNPPE